MKKRWWLIIMALLLILLVVFIGFNIKKGNKPLEIKRADIIKLSTEALNFQTKGDLLEARSAYQRLVSEFPNSSEIMNWQKKIEDLNIKLLFSPIITAKGISYTIKPGDSLVKIAKEFKTTPELIMKSNHLTDDKIFPGRKIKIWTLPFSIVIDKSQNTLILKSNEEIIKTYIVSTGVNNSTPVGNFKISNKLPNPTWFKAGLVVAPGSPDNILGSRWLGLNLPGYGIHGTIESQNLGKQVTQGCIRMSNSDIEELYTIIPEGTEVVIID